MGNSQEDSSTANLHELIRQHKNEEFKSIVSHANQFDATKIEGNTLLHTASFYDNTEVIQILHSLGFDINAKNTLKRTPLHVAFVNSKFQAAQILLSLHADILVVDESGTSVLQLCFQNENEVPDNIITSVLQSLKISNLSASEITDKLINVKCSVYQVLLMNDFEITGLMLDRIYQSIDIDDNELHSLFQRALTSGYPENLKVLLKHQFGFYYRDTKISMFLDYITIFEYKPSAKFYFKHFIDWGLVTHKFIKKMENLFQTRNEDDIIKYLDFGIDEYIRKYVGWELFVLLFANNEVDCMKIIKNRQFKINGFDLLGCTALHMAAINKNKEALLYLLSNGANPNYKNFDRETPIFRCYDNELVKLLLEAGADLQLIDNTGRSIIEVNFNECIIANICILEARGLLKPEIAGIIKNSSDDLPVCQINNHREDLEWMKTKKISNSATLFSVLVDYVDDAVRYVKNENAVKAILGMSQERELQPTYLSMLRKNLEKLPQMYELQSEARTFLGNVMEIYPSDHLVIEKIVNFLTFQDLQVFNET